MSDQSKSTLKMAAVALLLIGALAGSWYLGSQMGRPSAAPREHEAAVEKSKGKVYPDIRGRIVRLMPQEGMIRVDHQEVKGLMGAMTMDFPLADPQELAGLEPEQEILFDLVKMDGRYLAVRIRPWTAQTQSAADKAAPSHPDPLSRGDLVPDLSLVDAGGKPFQLRRLPGRHKVITFFYIRCPLQQFCPAQTRGLAQLQSRLGTADHDVHLVSLTLDGEHDNTEALATYAKQFDVDAARWTLAGAENPAAVRDFADRAGGRIKVDKKHGQIDHALVAIRVDDNRIVDFAYGLGNIEKMILGIHPATAPSSDLH